MNDAQGPSPQTPICPVCLRHLAQLLEDWHTFASTLSPLVTDEDRAHGHLLAVLDALKACQAGRHASN